MATTNLGDLSTLFLQALPYLILQYEEPTAQSNNPYLQLGYAEEMAKSGGDRLGGGICY